MVGAVILAAGLSRRMGQNKLTLMLDGIPIVEHVIRNLEVSDVDNIVLVYSEHTKEVKKIADRHGIRSFRNDNAEEGLSTSVVKGLTELYGNEGVMFLLGDQPFILTEDINSIVSKFLENRSKIIVPMNYSGRGNPILFPEKYFNEILDITGDSGAKQVLNRHEDEVVFVQVKDSKIQFDIDTPEDFETAGTHFNNNIKASRVK